MIALNLNLSLQNHSLIQNLSQNQEIHHYLPNTKYEIKHTIPFSYYFYADAKETMLDRNKLTLPDKAKKRLTTYNATLSKALHLSREEKYLLKIYAPTMKRYTYKQSLEYHKYLQCKRQGEYTFKIALDKDTDPESVDPSKDPNSKNKNNEFNSISCMKAKNKKYNKKKKEYIIYDPEENCVELEDPVINKGGKNSKNKAIAKVIKAPKLTENSLKDITNYERIKYYRNSGKQEIDDVFQAIINHDFLLSFKSEETDLYIDNIMIAYYQGVDVCDKFNIQGRSMTLLENACYYLNPKAIAFLGMVANCEFRKPFINEKEGKEYTCVDLIKTAKTVNANFEIPYEVYIQKIEYTEEYYNELVKMRDSYWDIYKYNDFRERGDPEWKTCDKKDTEDSKININKVVTK